MNRSGSSGLSGWGLDAAAVEVWSIPLGLLGCALGARAMAGDRGLRSWRALAPGLVVLLAPPLLVATNRPDSVPRVLLVVLLGVAVVLFGVGRRWQAPVVAGAVTLALHAVVQVGPTVARTLAAQPRWLGLGLAGALILGLGATYERRIREVREIRLRLGELR